MSLHESAKSETVANRLPKLKKSAYILIAFTLFSAAQALFMQSIVFSALESQVKGFSFISVFTSVLWLLSLVCGILALTTKSTALAKRLILAVVGVLVYFAINSLLYVDLVGVAVNGFLVWWAYELYQSVEALEIKVR